METFRSAILMTSVIVLAIVLYKRLIHVLRKDEFVARYAQLGEHITWNGSVGTISITLRHKSTLHLEIYESATNTRLSPVFEGEREAGDHYFDFNTEGFSQGKYYCKLTTPNQEASRYFEV